MEGELAGGALEMVNVEEMETYDEREALSERARRRSFRTQRGLDRKELRSMREEAAVLVAAKREATERKKNGKRVATPSQSRKSRPASLGVVIREAVDNPIKPLHHQEEEQNIGGIRKRGDRSGSKAAGGYDQFRRHKVKEELRRKSFRVKASAIRKKASLSLPANDRCQEVIC